MNEKTCFSCELGLTEAVTLVIGSMIGSGIFIAPSLMAGYIQNPLLLIFLWVIGGVFTLCGALSYAELAAAMPKAGGQYIYLREAFGPIWGFLYGWTLILVIQTGFIAAVAVAFAKYLGVFFPVLSESTAACHLAGFALSWVQIAAILCIIALTAINIFGVGIGARIQNLFTFLKMSALGALILAAFFSGKGNLNNLTASAGPVVPAALKMTFLAALAVAMSKALFAYDAWNSVTFVAEEIKEPQKNLPRALWIGTAVVTLFYTLATIAYAYLVPVADMAVVPDNRIGAAAAAIALGHYGLAFIAIAILISTFGCNNGLVLTGARVYYAMARDGLFFKTLGELHEKYKTPAKALWLQCAWACVLTLSGSYSDLLTYITCSSLVFTAMTLAGLFVLRKKRPDMERPYRVKGYPWVPGLYIVGAVFFIIYILAGDFYNSAKGLALVALGIPVYLVWSRTQAPPSATRGA